MSLLTFPWFLTLYYYLSQGVYPKDADDNTKRRIQYKCKLLMLDGDRVLEKKTGRELLHEGNAYQKIKEIHEEGHMGITNTLKKVSQFYLVHGGKELVTAVCKSCESCQFRARVRVTRQNPGVIFKTPRHPFFMIGIDAVGPLAVTEKNNRYILTAIDYLTRFPIAKAVPDITETTTAEFLWSIVKDFGVMNYCLSDRGSNFISTYVHEFLKQLGCKNIMTTSYRSCCNGMVESLNSRLVSTMAKMARDTEDIANWDNYIDAALMVLRSTVNSATGKSPSYLLYGYEFRTPAVWVSPREDFVIGEEEEELQERIKLIQDKMVQVRETARLKSDEYKKKAKIQYDKQVHFTRRYEVGELVLMKVIVPEFKFSDKWEGPFTILEVNKNGTYRLTGKNSKRIKHAVNGDKLRPFDQSVSHMIPDVATAQANEYFQSWLNHKVNGVKFVSVGFGDDVDL